MVFGSHLVGAKILFYARQRKEMGTALKALRKVWRIITQDHFKELSKSGSTKKSGGSRLLHCTALDLETGAFSRIRFFIMMMIKSWWTHFQVKLTSALDCWKIDGEICFPCNTYKSMINICPYVCIFKHYGSSELKLCLCDFKQPLNPAMESIIFYFAHYSFDII